VPPTTRVPKAAPHRIRGGLRRLKHALPTFAARGSAPNPISFALEARRSDRAPESVGAFSAMIAASWATVVSQWDLRRPSTK
jgi:hypothetical protein